jgi:uncharacterized membrane protein
MTEADKKKLGLTAKSPAHSVKGHGGGGGGGAMVPGQMMGGPMCAPMMGGGGYPGIGGMGPNLVFNFNQPYGYAMAAVVAEQNGKDEGGEEDQKEEKEPEPEYVQADPTWRNPRLVQKKGKPLKKEPCVIQ